MKTFETGDRVRRLQSAHPRAPSHLPPEIIGTVKKVLILESGKSIALVNFPTDMSAWHHFKDLQPVLTPTALRLTT